MTATRNEVRFDPTALRQSWDRQQEFHIPHRELRFQVMLEVLGAALPKPGWVLDIGCGTGSLSERILRRFPGARVCAVDFDPVLLKIGREGLGDFRGRLNWLEADLRSPGWARSLPAVRFDAAVSTTALHWLSRTELRRLLRTLSRRLRVGGVLLNGDSMPFDYPPSDKAHARIARVMRSMRREHSVKRPPRGVLTWDTWWRSVEQIPALRDELAERRKRYPRAHETVPPPSADWLITTLRSAGFREAATVWQEWTNCVLLAVR